MNSGLFLLGLILASIPWARADETSPEWQALVTPTSWIQLGIRLGDGGNASFANATGQEGEGLDFDAGFDLRGGSRHDAADPRRWRLLGENLGAHNPSLVGEYAQTSAQPGAQPGAEPGLYRLAFRFDRIEIGRASCRERVS
jgi:hypothetical protein